LHNFPIAGSEWKKLTKLKALNLYERNIFNFHKPIYTLEWLQKRADYLRIALRLYLPSLPTNLEQPTWILSLESETSPDCKEHKLLVMLVVHHLQTRGDNESGIWIFSILKKVQSALQLLVVQSGFSHQR
jgi:hypothetical protein